MSKIYRMLVSTLLAFVLIRARAQAESTIIVVQKADVAIPDSTAHQQTASDRFWLTKVQLPQSSRKLRPNAGTFKPLAAAQSYTYTELLNVPKPAGINNGGVIINFFPAFRITPPYSVSNIIPIGGRNTYVYAIDRNGDVAGAIRHSDQVSVPLMGAILLANGKGYSDYAPPPDIARQQGMTYGVDNYFNGINSHGLLVGVESGFGFAYHIDDLAVKPFTTGTFYLLYPAGGGYPTGVNELDEVIGFTGQVSFIIKGYSTQYFSVPGSISTAATGINDNEEIVGEFTGVIGQPHGFIYAAGRYTQVDFPGAQSTTVTGVNNTGDLVGTFTDRFGAPHGFIAKHM